MEQKSGIYTTELWITLSGMVINLAVAYNLLTADEASAWAAFMSAAVNVVLAAVYTWSRTRVKTNGVG